MYLCWTELFEIELFICINMDLALNNLQYVFESYLVHSTSGFVPQLGKT